eukprot:Lankesteria_metandrocarpae@DN3430_c0_g1_i2.p1
MKPSRKTKQHGPPSVKGVKVKGHAAADRPRRGRKKQSGGFSGQKSAAKTNTLKSRESILDGMKRRKSSLPKGLGPRELARREMAKQNKDTKKKPKNKRKVSKDSDDPQLLVSSGGVPCLPGAETAGFKARISDSVHGDVAQQPAVTIQHKLVFGKGAPVYVDAPQCQGANRTEIANDNEGKLEVQQNVDELKNNPSSRGKRSKQAGSSAGASSTGSGAKVPKSGWGDISEFGEVVERPSDYLQLLGERVAARSRKRSIGQILTESMRANTVTKGLRSENQT